MIIYEMNFSRIHRHLEFRITHNISHYVRLIKAYNENVLVGSFELEVCVETVWVNPVRIRCWDPCYINYMKLFL
jgi:hypothetical protein